MFIVLFFGDGGSGNACTCSPYIEGRGSIISRITTNTFDTKYHPSIGMNILTTTTSHEGKEYKVQLWEVTGTGKI